MLALLNMYINLIQITSGVQICEKLAHIRNYYGIYIYMFEVHCIVLLPFFACTLYTSQYSLRVKYKLLLVNIKGNQY